MPDDSLQFSRGSGTGRPRTSFRRLSLTAGTNVDGTAPNRRKRERGAFKPGRLWWLVADTLLQAEVPI